MHVATLVLLIIVMVVLAADTWFVYSRDMMMLQQNSYRNERYVRWFNQAKESTSTGRLFDLVAMFVLLLTNLPQVIVIPVAIIIYICQTVSLARKSIRNHWCALSASTASAV